MSLRYTPTRCGLRGSRSPFSRRLPRSGAVAEHLLRAPWLARASEVEGRGGETAHVPGEPVGVEASEGGACVRRAACGRRARRERVVEVLDSWREVGGWWGEGSVDRLVYRVSLSEGAVLDLARARDPAGSWPE